MALPFFGSWERVYFVKCGQTENVYHSVQHTQTHRRIGNEGPSVETQMIKLRVQEDGKEEKRKLFVDEIERGPDTENLTCPGESSES